MKPIQYSSSQFANTIHSNELPPLRYNEILTQIQKQHILSRFPSSVKLPYETNSNNSVITNEYNVATAISYGKRAYAWFTYYQNKDVCCILELDRENKIGSSIYFIEMEFPKSFSLGTVISGTIFEDANMDEKISKSYFIVENIFTLNGHILSTVYSERIGPLYKFFQELFSVNDYQTEKKEKETKEKETKEKETKEKETEKSILPFVCAVMWNYDSKKHILEEIPEEWNTQIPYTIRYIQYQSSNQILPLLNVAINKKPIWSPVIKDEDSKMETIRNNIYSNTTIPIGNFDYSRPIFKQTVCFMVMAEIPHDVYFLYLKDKHGKWVKFQHALILNYKTSVFMNGIFRKIKENQNLDYMEESDDDDEFEDLREDKFVDLQKQIFMECTFSFKFRLWTPVRVVIDSNCTNQLPSIEQFVFSNHHQNQNHPNSFHKNRENNRPSHSLAHSSSHPFHNSGRGQFRKPMDSRPNSRVHNSNVPYNHHSKPLNK